MEKQEVSVHESDEFEALIVPTGPLISKDSRGVHHSSELLLPTLVESLPVDGRGSQMGWELYRKHGRLLKDLRQSEILRSEREGEGVMRACYRCDPEILRHELERDVLGFGPEDVARMAGVSPRLFRSLYTGVKSSPSTARGSPSKGRILSPGAPLPVSGGEPLDPAGFSLPRGIDRSDDPAPFDPILATFPSASAMTCTPVVRFEYGDVSFEVPADWWREYEANPSSWGSVDEVLETYWAPYRTAFEAAGLSFDTIQEMLGCYNLEKNASPWDGHTFLFWNTGWGAPHHLFLHMCGLVGAFSSFIQDNSSWSDHCAGLGPFILTQLQGHKAWSSYVDEFRSYCRTKIHIRSDDSDFDSEYVSQACSDESLGCECDSEYDVGTIRCGLGFNNRRGVGIKWSNFDVFLTEDEYHNTLLSTIEGTYSHVIENTTLFGVGLGFGVTFHAAKLAFDGVRCDYALYLARIADDYFRESGDLDYFVHAWRLARFALRIVSDWSRYLIHEMGHSYVGSGHCEHSCCLDISAQHWLCKVRGYLGLPYHLRMPWYSGDAETEEVIYDSEVSVFQNRIVNGCLGRCDVRVLGVAGQNARFCGTTCQLLEFCWQSYAGSPWTCLAGLGQRCELPTEDSSSYRDRSDEPFDRPPDEPVERMGMET